MKRIAHRRRLLVMIIVLIATSCRMFPPRYAPPPLVPRASWHVPSAVTSNPDEIVFACDWKPADSDAKIFAFIVPPEVSIAPVVLDYSIVSVAPGGKTQTLSANEVQSSPELAGKIDVAKNIAVTDCGYIRFNRIARMELRRRLAAPEVKSALALKSVRVALRFDKPYAPPALRDQALQRADNGFGLILRHLAANPDAAALYAASSPPEHVTPNAEITALPDQTLYQSHQPWLKIPISEQGFYIIDAEYVKSNGWDPGQINPRSLRLFRRGVEVPTLLIGGSSTYFTPADVLIFYGLPADDTQYTSTNIYWLTQTPEATGLRISTLPSSPPPAQAEPQRVAFFTDTAKLEEDDQLQIQTGNFLSIRGMCWVWKQLLFDSPEEIAFDLPGLLRLPGKATLTLNLYFLPSRFEPNSRLRISINDQLTHEIALKSEKENSQDISISHEILRPHANTIRITVLRPEKKESTTATLAAAPEESEDTPPASGIYLDNIVIPYPRHLQLYQNQLLISADSTSPTLKSYAVKRDTNALVLGFDISDEKSPRFIKPSAGNVSDAFAFTVLEQGHHAYDFLTIGHMKRPPAARPPQFAHLRSPENAADYLIISHELFLPVLQPLVDLHTAQGFKTKLINVESIYDEFNDGIESPEAIKAFLSYALRTWQPPLPEYVLLVGDCTSDYKGYAKYAVTSEASERGAPGPRLVHGAEPNTARNFLPSYSHFVDEKEKQDRWASDHWFTTIAGADQFADLLLGRISVNNVEDARTDIEKIIRYSTQPQLGPWRATLGYVADNGIFDMELEDLRTNYTPPQFGASTIYFGRLPWEDNFYLPREVVEAEKAKVSTITTTRLLKTFDSGVSYLSFYGHGSPNIWSDERIWYGGDSKNSDNLHLRNLDRLPFIVTMTCNSGAIDYPVPRWNICISEDFMRVKEGGAIALYVPSGPGFTAIHKKMSTELHRALFYENVRRLADMIALADDRFLLKGDEEDLVRMFILLGDPALELQLPRAAFPLEISRREIVRGKPVTLSVSGTAPGVQGGKAVFSVFDGDNEQLVQEKEISMRGSRMNFSFDLPADAKRGTWTAHAYCWNESTGADAAGAAQFVVDSPYVTLDSFEVSPPESKTPVQKATARDSAGETVSFKAAVTNHSLLRVTNARVALTQEVRGKTSTLEQRSIDFLPEETKTLTFSAAKKPGLNVFRLKVLDYAQPPEPATMHPSAEKNIALPAPLSGHKVDLAFDPRFLEKSLRPSGAGAILTLDVPVFNLGAQAINGARVVLLGKGGDRRINASRGIPMIQPGSQYKAPLTSTLFATQGTLAPTSATITLELPAALKDENPKDNVMTVQIAPEDLPDLAISSDDITFDPESPTDGFTVFVNVMVHNIGKSAAHDFSVCAYDADPRENGGGRREAGSKKAKPLENLVSDPARKLDYLAPGSSVKVVLRWDPIHNAGKNTIFVRVDSDNQVVEARKDNNIASGSLSVRTKAILRPAGISFGQQTPEQRQSNVMPLVARVRNDGETAAREVYVTFFSEEEQQDENRLGDVLIGDINPGETREGTYLWQIKKEDLHRLFRPSFQIYLKGSSQRISSTELARASGLQKPD